MTGESGPVLGDGIRVLVLSAYVNDKVRKRFLSEDNGTEIFPLALDSGRGISKAHPSLEYVGLPSHFAQREFIGVNEYLEQETPLDTWMQCMNAFHNKHSPRRHGPGVLVLCARSIVVGAVSEGLSSDEMIDR